VSNILNQPRVNEIKRLLKESLVCRLLLRHLHGTVNLDLIRSEEAKERNQALIPYKALALAFLFGGEAYAFAKVDGRLAEYGSNSGRSSISLAFERNQEPGEAVFGQHRKPELLRYSG
jgi:hypothetical protein